MLSKTPKASARRIKSARKLMLIGLAGIAVVALGLVIFIKSNTPEASSDAMSTNPDSSKQYCLKLTQAQSDCSLSLEVADTDKDRAQGLSGRSPLADQTGMIFVFDQPGRQCMWMKDMHFNLDMVWLDTDKHITKIAADVQPDSYPQEFCSVSNDLYVIEMNAGTAARLGLQTGQALVF